MKVIILMLNPRYKGVKGTITNYLSQPLLSLETIILKQVMFFHK